jgi:hypothetical protein
MSALIQINVRKEDGTYINYMGDISDYFDLSGNNIRFFEMQTKQEREQKKPRKYVFTGKVVWSDGKINAHKLSEKIKKKL